MRRAYAALALALAALAPTAAPALAAPPFGTESYTGVRPGTVLRSGTELCTFGFIFEGTNLRGTDRHRYAVTAGHCAFSPDPARNPGRTQTWKPGAGPVVLDGADKPVGRFVYATFVGEFGDFALIRLDDTVKPDPRVCHFGGPTALTTAVNNDDVQVHHYGAAVGVGDMVPARTGDMFFGLYRSDYVYFYGAASEGDSGSPVVDDEGAAIGIITDLTTPFTGNVGVNRIADEVAAAEKALRIRLTLLTAPLA